MPVKPVKHSVAVLIFKGDFVLSVRRPDNDDELPGIWGLPAGTCREGESPEDVVTRIGREKLGVTLTPLRILTSGSQERPAYSLKMDLFEALMDGEPSRCQWQWASSDIFSEGALEGSLCCQLALSQKPE